jgi:hypothetical protein
MVLVELLYWQTSDLEAISPNLQLPPALIAPIAARLSVVGHVRGGG